MSSFETPTEQLVVMKLEVEEGHINEAVKRKLTAADSLISTRHLAQRGCGKIWWVEVTSVSVVGHLFQLNLKGSNLISLTVGGVMQNSLLKMFCFVLNSFDILKSYGKHIKDCDLNFKFEYLKDSLLFFMRLCCCLEDPVTLHQASTRTHIQGHSSQGHTSDMHT